MKDLWAHLKGGLIVVAVIVGLRIISILVGFDRYYIPVLDSIVGAILRMFEAISGLGIKYFPHL